MKKKRIKVGIFLICALIGIVFSCCIQQEREIPSKTPRIVYPEVLSTSPVNHASGVSPTATITIEFSRSMYESEIAHKALCFTPSISTEGITSRWIDSKTLEISDLVLTYGTEYTITLDPEQGELKDTKGNYLRAYSWSFTVTSVPIVDLLDAIDQNFVEASVTGWKDNLVILRLTKLTEDEIEITVPRGLIVQSLDSSKANMAMEDVVGVISSITPGYLTTINYYATTKIMLDKEEKRYLVGAYNVEFTKLTPEYKGEFSMGKVDHDIQRIIDATDALEICDKSADAVQTAIWCFTDDVSKEELLEKREIRDKEILDAKIILELAEMEISSKKLFAEKVILLSANINERVEDERVILYVTGMDETDKIKSSEPEEGCRWAIVDLIIKNKMNEPLRFTPYKIVLRDSNNRTQVYTHSHRTNDLDFGIKEWDIPPKVLYRGELTFEVPEEISTLLLSYDDSVSYGEIELVQSHSPEPMPVHDFVSEYEMGERATDENIVIVVTSKKEKETVGDTRAEEDWEFLILDITLENISTRSLPYGCGMFYIQGEEGYLFEYHYVTSQLETPFDHGNFNPGEIYRGEIAFKVPVSLTCALWYSPYSGLPICINLEE